MDCDTIDIFKACQIRTRGSSILTRRAVVVALCWLLATGMAPASGTDAAAVHGPLVMSFWSDDTARHAGDPMPGSQSVSGSTERNPGLQRKLDAINVLAYAFLKVDAAGTVYFAHPDIDLAASDARQYCHSHPAACPDAASARAGSFSAFARLDNRYRTLQRIISVGGAGSQSTLDNALSHPDVFIQSAVSLIRAYHLDGIDLDLEPDAFFNPGQGERYAELVMGLRQALGGRAFISIEVPGDWETLRSIDCPAYANCRRNLALVATNAHVSLMGYEYHGPLSPGTVTGNNSNLYGDPEEPLLPRFYHASDNQAVGYLTFMGVPAEKILLGVPAYFICYGGVEAAADSNGLYQPFDRSQTVAYDLGSQGSGTYRVAQRLLGSGFVSHRLLIGGKLSAVYAYNEPLHQWLSYEDTQSVAAKADYVRAKHLAGMMLWEIGEDVPIDDPQSLLGSMHRALFGTTP